MDEQRRQEIQKYIDSLANTEAYDEDSYEIKLENFEGPIDLLWYLIRKSKIDIMDIFVSQITDQYLAVMNQVDKLDMDVASDFLGVAACLIEIKSKKILPTPPIAVDPEDDPEKYLMDRLLEYREKYYPLYKDASKKMKETENTDSFYRAPDSSVGKPVFVLADMNMDGLIKALQKMFIKLEQKAKNQQVKTIAMDRFSVEDMVIRLKSIFREETKVTFYDLIEEDYSKVEIITTFQAILELLKAQYLKLQQDKAFDDIFIEKNPDADENAAINLDDYENENNDESSEFVDVDDMDENFEQDEQ